MFLFSLRSLLFPPAPRYVPPPAAEWVHVRYEGPAQQMETFLAATGLAEKSTRKRRTGIGKRVAT